MSDKLDIVPRLLAGNEAGLAKKAAHEIDRLRAEMIRLRTPSYYWSELDEDVAYDDVDEFFNWSDIEPGCAFHVRPLRELDEEWYGVVPDPTMAEFEDGVASGGRELVGPFATRREAVAEAERRTEAFKRSEER